MILFKESLLCGDVRSPLDCDGVVPRLSGVIGLVCVLKNGGAVCGVFDEESFDPMVAKSGKYEVYRERVVKPGVFRPENIGVANPERLSNERGRGRRRGGEGSGEGWIIDWE